MSKFMNRYTLRLKDIPLLEFVLQEKKETLNGVSVSTYSVVIDKIYQDQIDLLPKNFDLTQGGDGLLRWIKRRKAPKNRQFVEKITQAISDDKNPLRYVDVTCALSLNDAYWITNECQEKKWAECNLYQHPFDEILSQVAFTGYSHKVSGVVTSPELTSSGMLKKCWSNLSEGIYLLKGDDYPSSDNRSQVTLEYYAAQVADALGFSYIPYYLEVFKHRDGHKEIICKSKIFTSEDVGFINAYDYLLNLGKADYLQHLDELYYQNKIAQIFGDAYYDMMLFDSIIANRDRHLGNFGVLVNNNTNEVLGMAPIFDNGLSLFCGASKYDLYEGYDDYVANLSCKYFSLDEQAKFFVQKRHLPKLRKLLNFTFRRHPQAECNVSEETLKILEKFVRQRAGRTIELFDEKI